MEKMNIQDNSGDRKYFTIIPNYIANHSTANDQALYFQMKRFAGEDGECFASEVLLRKKLGIGTKALKKSIQYLLDHNWISETGFKEVTTKGGIQKIRVYSINDIWKLNNESYEGYAERTPLNNKGYAESNQRVCQKEAKGYAERTTNKNHREEEPYKKMVSVATLTPKEMSISFFEGKNHYEDMYSAFSGQIPNEVLKKEFQKFVLYWTEPNKTGTKQRWEMQPTFDVKRRLFTWLSKNKDYQSKNKYNVGQV